MPSKAVADAVQARLQANWSATPIVEYDTEAYTPTNVNGFVVVQFPVANGSQPVLGRHFQEDGAIRIVLNVREGIGLGQGLEWADTLAGIFRTVKFSGVETFAPHAPIVDSSNDDGNWISYAVVVPYRYQFNG